MTSAGAHLPSAWLPEQTSVCAALQLCHACGTETACVDRVCRLVHTAAWASSYTSHTKLAEHAAPNLSKYTIGLPSHTCFAAQLHPSQVNFTSMHLGVICRPLGARCPWRPCQRLVTRLGDCQTAGFAAFRSLQPGSQIKCVKQRPSTPAVGRPACATVRGAGWSVLQLKAPAKVSSWKSSACKNVNCCVRTELQACRAPQISASSC